MIILPLIQKTGTCKILLIKNKFLQLRQPRAWTASVLALIVSGKKTATTPRWGPLSPLELAENRYIVKSWVGRNIVWERESKYSIKLWNLYGQQIKGNNKRKNRENCTKKILK